MFSPFELNPMPEGGGIAINSTGVLCWSCNPTRRRHGHGLGMRGMEVRDKSGERGYYEVQIVHYEDGGVVPPAPISVGLAIDDADLNIELGLIRGSLGWSPKGIIWGNLGTQMNVIAALELRSVIDEDAALKFSIGDVVGIMVDCTEVSTLRFFVNGGQAHWMLVTPDVQGQVLYPAFCLSGNNQIRISSNPNLPTV